MCPQPILVLSIEYALNALVFVGKWGSSQSPLSRSFQKWGISQTIAFNCFQYEICLMTWMMDDDWGYPRLIKHGVLENARTEKFGD